MKSHSLHFPHVRAFAALYILISLASAHAVPVTDEQAAAAAANFVAAGGTMGVNFAGGVQDVRAVTAANGAAPFRVVKFADGGFIVTSGDTEDEPFVFISDGPGDLVEDDENPLWGILRHDMSANESARSEQSARAASGGAKLLSASRAENKWAKWLPSTKGGALLRDAQVPDNQVSDICVPRIMDVRWNQRGSGSASHYYNNDIPHHCAVGCVAVALGQIIRHYQWPSTIGQVTRTCRIWNGLYGIHSAVEPNELTTSGAIYNWNAMPAAPDSYSNPPGQAEVSRFLFDVGITIGTKWSAPSDDTSEDGGSGGSSYTAAADALTNIWGYADAVCCFHDASVPGENTYPTGETYAQRFKRIKDVYLPCLAAGMPVLSSIKGHDVVTDGYGYSDGNLYFHINYGWGGTNNNGTVTKNTGWYVATQPIQGHETGLWAAVYNISTNRVGAIFSGRVYGANDTPLGNSPVVAVGPDGTQYRTTSNPAGVYAFNLEPGSYLVYATNGSEIAYRDVITIRNVSSMDEEDYGTVGNVSEVDLHLDPGSSFWTGGGDGTHFSDPGNWSPAHVPSAASTLVFPSTADDVTLNNDISDLQLSGIVFLPSEHSYTITNKSIATAPSATNVFTVVVASGTTATISSPMPSGFNKMGQGTLVLTQSRAGQETTLEEGTLRFANNADIGSFVFGTDPAKRVTLDYGYNYMTEPLLTDFLRAGMDETLTNGLFGTGTNALSFTEANLPSVLTIAKNAIVCNKQFTVNINDGSTHTINIAGGAMINTREGNHWLMQNALSGRLNINVTDGGLLEFWYEAYALTCRDNRNYNDPSLHLVLKDSTLRVRNDKSIRLGWDGENDNATRPVGVFAATNSVIDVYGVFIGNDKVGTNTAGSYTADFDSCVVSAQQFRVFHDRPLNAVRFNDTRLVLKKSDDYWLTAADEFASRWNVKPISVGAGGLVMDSNGANGSILADLQGPGAITKVGAGRLTIGRNQTGTGPLVCQAGDMLVGAGLTVTRPLTVKSGARLSLATTSEASLGSLAFEADTALNIIIDPTTNATPATVGTLTLPASGTVALTMDGGAFTAGNWAILRTDGLAISQVESTFVPQVQAGNAYWFDVVDDELRLVVTGQAREIVWTGNAGDGKMSTGGNWLGGSAPVSGDRVFFNTAATVLADLGAHVRLSGLVLEQVVTFTGNLTAQTINDTSKVAVGTNSTVTLDGDLEFAGSGTKHIAHHVATNGEFVVTGIIRALPEYSGNQIFATSEASDGFVVAKGLVSDTTHSEPFPFRLTHSNGWTDRWAIGSAGLSGPKGFWMYKNSSNPRAIIRADADFTISTTIGDRNTLTFDTTGKDGQPHTVRIGDGVSGGLTRDGVVNVVGTGAVEINYDWTEALIPSEQTCTLTFNVEDTAKLKVLADAWTGDGTITAKSGATLGLGANAHVENATIQSGATLLLPDAATASPWVSGTLTLGDGAKIVLGGLATNVVAVLTQKFKNSGATAVSLSADAAPPATGKYTLIDVKTLNLPDESASTFTFDTSSLHGYTATITYNSTIRLSEVYLNIVAPTPSSWPATWNNGAPPNNAMQEAFDAWKDAYNVTTFDEAAETAFLLGIAPTQQLAELRIQSIALDNGFVTLTTDKPLNLANGVVYVYVRYVPAPDALSDVKSVTINPTTGAVTFPYFATAEFYTLCVGYTIPSSE